MLLEKWAFQLAASDLSECFSGWLSRLSAPRLCTGAMAAMSCRGRQGG